MNLFYFTRIIPIAPMFGWNCFNYPNSIEAVGIYPNVSDCIQISMKLLYTVLPKLEWSCLKLPKLEWSCSTWPKFEWNYYCLLKVDIVYLYFNLPKFSNSWKYF